MTCGLEYTTLYSGSGASDYLTSTNLTTFSLYIHYPFCLRRCPYCGFATQVEQRGEAERYRDRLMKELRIRLAEQPWRGSAITSVYFGGGTPSLMPPEFCASILQLVNSSIPEPTNRQTVKPSNRQTALEVTLEANPGTLDLEKLAAFKKAGINRLSIGAQSFQHDELQLLGRIHDAAQIAEAVVSARKAGFDNLSLDLIYGVPGQTVASFNDSVRSALDHEAVMVNDI